MNPEDLAMQKAERQASPERWAKEEVEATEPAERIATVTSSGSAASSVDVQEMHSGISRIATQRDDVFGLERHPTALSRIETHRSQQSATVGAGLKSRTTSKQSRPLPAFGAGKPFPPPLPEREQYVVEFDGPDDPMHAMNWPWQKK